MRAGSAGSQALERGQIGGSCLPPVGSSLDLHDSEGLELFPAVIARSSSARIVAIASDSRHRELRR